MGGRGAGAFEKGVEKSIRDMIKGRGGVPKDIDPSKYGSLRNAEAAIRALRRERALIYEDIANSPIASYQGGKHSVSVDPGQLISGRTLTHNHPDARFGGTFSFADLSMATTKGMRSTRAAAREGSYYLKPRANARPEAFNKRIAKDIPMLERRMRNRAKQIKKAVKSGKITYKQANAMQRTRIVGELHKYYKKVASEYGFEYGRQKLNKTRR